MKRFPSRRRLVMVASFILFSCALSLRAQISFVDIYRTGLFNQTGNGSAGLAYAFSYIGLDLTAESASEYTTVRTFYPGPDSPVTLLNDNPANPALYEFTSGSFASQASMDIAYPTGTYSFTANGGGPSATTMINYASDAYSATQPYLTGTNYSDLQGMNSASNFTFQLSPYVKDATATDAFIFLNVYDAVTGDVVFGANFLSSSTNSVLLPANTLQPSKEYVFDLDYSDRVDVASPGADFDGILGFDLRTEGNFTTGVPEPSAGALAFFGFAALSLLRRPSRAHV